MPPPTPPPRAGSFCNGANKGCDEVGRGMQVDYSSVKRKPYATGQRWGSMTLTYHHLVGKKLISDWWNDVVCTAEGRKALAPLAEAIGEHATQYNNKNKHASKTDADAWREWAQNTDTKMKSFYKFQQIVTWMPGDLVRGPPPGERKSDPGSEFDHEVAWYRGCLSDGKAVATYFTAAAHAIRGYCDGDATIVRAQEGANNMAKVATIQGDAAPFRPKEWGKGTRSRGRGKTVWIAQGASVGKVLYEKNPKAYCEHYGGQFDTQPYYVDSSPPFEGQPHPARPAEPEEEEGPDTEEEEEDKTEEDEPEPEPVTPREDTDRFIVGVRDRRCTQEENCCNSGAGCWCLPKGAPCQRCRSSKCGGW
mmetsp:Transcript_30758/g.89474  ORF Transcript_30758/g.89474 Transcript_30758/m.89474 type:complete len:363 (-) Transcript_30758:228-1316(-)